MLRDLMNNDIGLNEWISHPRVGEWLATAAAFPDVMAVEVVGRSAIAQSLRLLPSEPFPSEVYFANQLVKDLWRGMELTVAFRYFVDSIIGREKTGIHALKFYQYLSNAAGGLYDESNALGDRPPEVRFEVFLLRPPSKSGRWGAAAFISTWGPDNVEYPSFLMDYKVVPVDPDTIHTIPLERVDGSEDPTFDTPTSFPAPSKYEDPFDPTKPCINDPAFDTEFERFELALIQKLAGAQATEGTDDDLFPELPSEIPVLEKELSELRQRPFDKRLVGPLPPPAAQSKRPPGPSKNFFEHMLQSLQKKPRQEPSRATPSGSGAGGFPPSGVQYKNVPPPGRQPLFDDPLLPSHLRDSGYDDTKMPAGPATPRRAGHSTNVDSDDSVQEVENPSMEKLQARFASPPGESAATAIVVDAGARDAIMAKLRRRRPVADKNAVPFVPTRHSLFEEGGAFRPSAQSGGGSTALPAVALWCLSDTTTGYPAWFAFWSLLLVFQESSFQGSYSVGSRKGRPVDPADRLFPALISVEARSQFFAQDNRQFEEWVTAMALRARRDASLAQSGKSTGWLQPGENLNRISRETLHQLRSGELWSCSSFFERNTEPSKTNFTVFSLLPSRSHSATGNLLPAEGLTYDECIEVLRNLFFLLSLPVTQRVPGATAEKLDAILESTVLLSTLRLFLDRLCDDPRSFHAVSIRSFWDTRCDAAARNNLAFCILAHVDQLLSMMSTFVTDPSPTVRPVHDAGDADNIYLVVDPTVRTSSILGSPAAQEARDPHIPSIIRKWGDIVYKELSNFARGDPSAIPAAPSCYIEQKKRPPSLITKKGKYGDQSQGSPARKKQQQGEQRRSRAAIAIMQWGPQAPDNPSSTTLQELLKNNRPQPRFPAPTDGDKNAKLICFAYTFAGHEGCTRPSCAFAHIDGLNPSQKGPNAFGNLTRYLDSQNIKNVIVYTDTGRRLADES
jgi:hypothetical protein